MKCKNLLCAFLLLGFSLNGIHAQVSKDEIIPPGSTLTKLSSNQFVFTEAPVWYGDSVLLFVDDGISAPNIFTYSPIVQQFSVFHNYSVNYNGLACNKDGNLLACESNNKRVVLMNNAGEVIEILATNYNGNPFNGPNDLIADNMRGVYFTDPVFFGNGTQDKKGVYYIDSTGNVTRIIDELIAPNGVILSPDGHKLYVVDTDNKYLYSWDVASDGMVSGKTTLAVLQTNGGVVSGADGMAIDIHGNIYIASDKGIQVFSPQGMALTIITVPEISSNCDFGGADFKTLFITAHKNLYSIDLNYAGYTVSRSTSPNGVGSIPGKSLVEIYPNPVQNELHINLEGNKGMLEINDISGKSLIQKEILENNASIDVSGLNQGIYLVKVLLDKQILTGKFVKN
jgi:gluconolactonase